MSRQDRASRPPPVPCSSGFVAQQAGEIRAEAVLAKSFFAKVGLLLTGKSGQGT